MKLVGYWLKPISKKQINKTWTEKMITVFMSLEKGYSEITEELYIIASKGD